MNQIDDELLSKEHLLETALEKGIEFFGAEDSEEKRMILAHEFKRFLESRLPELSKTFERFLNLLRDQKALVVVYPENGSRNAGILTEDSDPKKFSELNEILHLLEGRTYELFLVINVEKIARNDSFPVTILHEVGAHFARLSRGEFLGARLLDEEVGAVLETAILYGELKAAGEELSDPVYDEIIKIASSSEVSAEALRSTIRNMLAAIGYKNRQVPAGGD